MHATEQLKHDHEVIEKLLDVLDAATVQAEAGAALPDNFLPRVVDVIRNFADKCHHAKEEEGLFPALERHGLARQTGPISVMLIEHEQGRVHVRNLEEAARRFSAGDVTALRLALGHAHNYVLLLRSHIFKENTVLFDIADRTLSPREQEQLHEQFEEIEEKRLGPGKHEEYVKMIEGWSHDFSIEHHYKH